MQQDYHGHNRSNQSVPLASASSSYMQFPPAVDGIKLPWNNNINNNVEEVGGGFKLNGVLDHHDYSTIQQMKFEIEDSIQNGFIPFGYFIA
ncbi:NAC domain-containing protein 21/22-like [Cucumis melo var. makuwa]|uniref:NAC domain-containing protein 21/22-like n=1 Tax=Cucumis melo var. makuwa TaxID=1194695 RepID=A0A5A7SK01_CUCMM|nr:NAC domain-containing protein 21/22-like [Cucumis melo var. makuwa]TYK11586.1 NAC domain-containing protein 21/22-like [Cucumis melo var. makuwa]